MTYSPTTYRNSEIKPQLGDIVEPYDKAFQGVVIEIINEFFVRVDWARWGDEKFVEAETVQQVYFVSRAKENETVKQFNVIYHDEYTYGVTKTKFEGRDIIIVVNAHDEDSAIEIADEVYCEVAETEKWRLHDTSCDCCSPVDISRRIETGEINTYNHPEVIYVDSGVTPKTRAQFSGEINTILHEAIKTLPREEIVALQRELGALLPHQNEWNGYDNRVTWAVSVNIDNDANLYRTARSIVRMSAIYAPSGSNVAFRAGEALEKWFSRVALKIENWSGVQTDVFSSGLSAINWTHIAEHILEGLE
jgi:hypothetical protein